MKNFSTLKKISLILLTIVLLPALFYSGYEISSLSRSEELFGRMYQQQLDAVLFSLNQYAYDVVSDWVSGMQNALSEQAPGSSRIALRNFIERKDAIRAAFICDTSLQAVIALEPAPGGPRTMVPADRAILALLRSNNGKIDRLLEFQRVGYRKIEPMWFTDSSRERSPMVLAFIVRDRSSVPRIGGVLMDEGAFVLNILSRKLSEVAGEEFILAVMDKRSGDIITSTSAVRAVELKQSKQVWLFPNYVLGIRLKGETIDELVQSRFTRNMYLIVALDVVLLAGTWLVYRTIRREMELVRLKSDFVSNVSHELRTPLSLIRMFAETLEMKRVKTEKKKTEYYRTILQETERLTRLVNNILSFSRMEAGRREYHFHSVDLNSVVKSVLDVYEYQLHAKGFATSMKLAERLPAIIGDDEALAEALHNIVDNAIKYSGEGKYLAAQTGMRQGRVFVQVQDKGIGIAAQHHARIFEKFFRVSGGLVHTAKGSGLGLSLAQHIVQAHHGRIEVESEPGKGSTFRLLFPAVEERRS